jgi:DNA-binding NarL/FixJ family response regulator
MSGPALVEWLAARFPDTKVLFMSGYTDEALVPHGVPLEGVAFLHKPFTPTTLTQRIREILDAPRPAAAA